MLMLYLISFAMRVYSRPQSKTISITTFLTNKAVTSLLSSGKYKKGYHCTI